MPFQSEKQRKYLWANEPEIAREWTDKYGSRVKKQEGGGIWNFIKDKSGYTQHNINNQLLRNALDAGQIDENQYKRMGGYDVAQQFPGGILDVPMVGASSLFYNLAKSGFNIKDPTDRNAQFGKYGPAESTELNVRGATGLNPADLQIYNSLMGGTYGTGPAIMGRENMSQVNKEPLSRNLNFIGEGIYNLGNAFKNEFGGSAEAEEMTIEELRDYFEGLSPEDLGLPKRGEADWEKYMRGQIADVPRLSNEEYLAQRGDNLYAGSTGNISGVKWKDDKQPFTFSKYQGPSQEEEGWDYRTPKKIGMLEKLRNRFYKPAAGAVNYGGKTYTPAQLNSMNALGGYYSEPARNQRRLEARRTNILNRAAKGKPVGNVNKLLGQYGYTGTPGSGTLQFTGKHEGSSTAGAGYTRDDSGWQSSPFRKGGLATLWRR